MNSKQIEQTFACIHQILKENYVKERKIKISLYGGEPLLPTTVLAVEKILEKVREYSYFVSIITNGTQIGRFMSLFDEYRDVVGSFIITLDGPQDVHDQRRKFADGRGTFNCIVQGIDLLIASGFKIHISSILDAHNLSRLPDLAEFIIAKGWHKNNNILDIRTGKVMFPLGNCSEYPYFLSEAELIHAWYELRESSPVMEVFNKNLMGDLQVFSHLHSVFEQRDECSLPKLGGCAAVYPGVYAFGPDNLVYPCAEVVGRPKFAIGSFSDKLVWFDQRENWKKWNVWNFAKCRGCKFLTLCGGSCPLEVFRGDGKIREPVCPDVESIISAYLQSRIRDINQKFNK
jgi:uncharacterized protein